MSERKEDHRAIMLSTPKERRNLYEFERSSRSQTHTVDKEGAMVVRDRDVEIGLASGEVRRGGAMQHPRQKSQRVLSYLIEHRGCSVSKQELLLEARKIVQGA